MTTAQHDKWETFDDKDEEEEEALSLSDLPELAPASPAAIATEPSSDDFDFRISPASGLLEPSAADAAMCAADEVFFRGQLLPLRPSFSSSSADGGLLRCGSLSDSTDRSPSTVLSLGFDSTSRSASSNSSQSSRCVSRSHSSGGDEPPRRSASNYLYAFPSPSPRLQNTGKGGGGAARRKSTSSAAPPPAWGVLRLGVVPAPEIGLAALRSRREGTGGSSRFLMNAGSSTERSRKAAEKRAPMLLGGGFGFGCRCSPDAVEPVVGPPPPSSSRGAKSKKKKEEGGISERREEGSGGLKRGETLCRSRILQWLEELSVAKAPPA